MLRIVAFRCIVAVVRPNVSSLEWGVKEGENPVFVHSVRSCGASRLCSFRVELFGIAALNFYYGEVDHS